MCDRVRALWLPCNLPCCVVSGFRIFQRALQLCTAAAASGAKDYCNEAATRIICEAIATYFDSPDASDGSVSWLDALPIAPLRGMLAADVAADIKQAALDMSSSIRCLPVCQRDSDACVGLVSGRSIARVLHGVQSPLFPAADWRRHRYPALHFWR